MANQPGLMEFRTPGTALTSQTDITNAAAAGDVTIQKTPIIVECSVIFTPGGGRLPRARITPHDYQQREPTGDQ